MQEDVRKDFLPLVSKPWWFMTWLTRTLAVLLLLVMFLVLLILPVIICKNIMVLVVVSIVYYPALGFGLYRFILYQKTVRKREVKKIVVDDKGVHYERKNGTIDRILYQDLEKYHLADEYDVNLSPRNKIYVLQVKHNDSVINVDFDGVDAGYSSYIVNLRALRRKYIQGIVYFRPDLRINPCIYTTYNINPVDFTFDKKKYWTAFAKTLAVLILLGSVLGCIMLGLVKWLSKDQIYFH
ncbi:hypothetical protein FW781_16975 [Chryseobacterium panacisoli]|uniref:Uncharacterized protein n=1 Tax=Chryseobacterium panacisoli TaxID=1807141 RepID=A0A5D8ZGY8_9FLAO|nr:hypothetical protein [Chryseobacterium panacisoli]TZF94295.1 hypothetical protein FW781_16975 [Chryseobacterium panacisoli]